MSIDLNKNKAHILKAFNDVVNDKNATDWALFGYEGQTNVLKVVGTGEDGLLELTEDLNSSKIMYGVLKVTDPSTTRPKIVLINWQGEGSPVLRKGQCARHLPDINKLLVGIHVTINARIEEEVEESEIMAAVVKCHSTSYNFNERSEISDKTIPVGTNYKRTNPLAEINSNSRNQFWEGQEVEERRRKMEEQQHKNEEVKKLEKERKEREIMETKQREAVNKERNARISDGHKAEETATRRLKEHAADKFVEDAGDRDREEAERHKRAEMLRQDRKKEAESLIGKSTVSARAIFENKNQTPPTQLEKRPPKRVLKEFNPVNNHEGDENPSNNESPSTPARRVASRWPPAGAEATPPHPHTPVQLRENHGAMSSAGLNTPTQAVVSAPNTPPPPPSKQPPEGGQMNLPEESLPVRTLLKDSESTPQITRTQGLNIHSQPPNSEQPNNQTSASAPVDINIQINQLTTSIETVTINNQDPEPESEIVVEAYKHSPINNNNNNVKNIDKIHDPEPEIYTTSIHQAKPATVQPENEHMNPYPSTYTNGDLSTGVGSSTQKVNGVNSTSGHQTTAARNDEHSSSRTHAQENTTAPTNASANVRSHSQSHHIQEEVYTTDLRTATSANTNNVPAMGMVYEVDGMEYQILPEHGLCARALYDYQAADDTEITFDPGEIITNVDQIDEGWWQGVGPDGNFGLFPANYVECINGHTV